MGRTRRNKRGKGKILDSISNETVKKVVVVCVPIIVVCIGILAIRLQMEKMQMEKQRIKLEQEIASIFEAPVNVASKEETKEKEGERKEEIASVQIAFVGDILCNDAILQDGKNAEGYDFSHQFGQIGKIIEKADIAIGTMETNFTTNGYSGYQKYNSPIEFAKAVKQTGVNVVSLAHNHSLDYGKEGLVQTKQALEQIQMQTIGTKEESTQKRYQIKEINGIKLALLAYTYGFSNEEKLSTEEKQNVNIYEEMQAKEDLRSAKQEADFTIVIMHWGEINHNQASDKQKQIAEFLTQNGAGAIIGSHPAVVEPMEIKQNQNQENVLVAYSLGNYISSLGYENSNLELVLNVEIKKENGKASLQKVSYTPMYVLDKGAKAKERFTVLDMREAAKQYTEGAKNITKAEYNRIIKGIDKLEEIIR